MNCWLCNKISCNSLYSLFLCFSVDPPGCTDIDDALHCRELDDGRVEVIIAFMLKFHFETETLICAIIRTALISKKFLIEK